MKRRKNPFPGSNTVENRHGKLWYRLRRTIRGCTVDTYLLGPYGSPEFRAAYEEACEGARLAEHDATEWEVMAFLAHRTAKEASRYTAAANRAKLTTTGMAKLGADPEQIFVQPSRKVGQLGSLTP